MALCLQLPGLKDPARSGPMLRAPELREMESLPLDVVHAVLERLEPREVCRVAMCSRSLAAICAREELWRSLYLRRWPQGMHSSQAADSWREALRQRAAAAAGHAKEVVAIMEKAAGHSESLEVVDYRRAMESLVRSGLGEGDVARLLLQARHSVLVNLLALHYCLQHRHADAEQVSLLLAQSEISNRIVCVRSWTLGGWAASGYRRRDEMKLTSAMLGDLSRPDVVATLRGARGVGAPAVPSFRDLEPESQIAVHLLQSISLGTVNEIMRVQISADFVSSAWIGCDVASSR